MPRLIDLTGQKFGRLNVICRDGSTIDGRAKWLCKCDCGKETAVSGKSLVRGETKSCSCLQKEKVRQVSFKHGYANSIREYRIWKSIRQRCNNPSHKNWSVYGGVGITICARWNSFENFIEDMGIAPSDTHTIDRINGTLGYSKENCRWATRLEQSRNIKSNKLLTFNGQTKPVSEWAEELNISKYALYQRLDRLGWSVEDALKIPVEKVVPQLLTYNGKTKTIYQWAETLGLSTGTIGSRLNRLGWSVEKTLTTPPRRKANNK